MAKQDDSLLADVAAVARDRDREAFARLFAFYAPRVKAYLKRLKVEDAAAEDLAQDVMLTLWRRAAQFDRAKAGLSTWVYTIARNRRIDVLRRERHPEPELDDPALMSTFAPRGDDALEATLLSERIKAAVEQLPKEQADLLKIFYFEDKTHTAIAQETGLPLGTVKSRLRLAVGRMRALLDDVR